MDVGYVAILLHLRSTRTHTAFALTRSTVVTDFAAHLPSPLRCLPTFLDLLVLRLRCVTLHHSAAWFWVFICVCRTFCLVTTGFTTFGLICVHYIHCVTRIYRWCSSRFTRYRSRSTLRLIRTFVTLHRSRLPLPHGYVRVVHPGCYVVTFTSRSLPVHRVYLRTVPVTIVRVTYVRVVFTLRTVLLFDHLLLQFLLYVLPLPFPFPRCCDLFHYRFTRPTLFRTPHVAVVLPTVRLRLTIYVHILRCSVAVCVYVTVAIHVHVTLFVIPAALRCLISHTVTPRLLHGTTWLHVTLTTTHTTFTFPFLLRTVLPVYRLHLVSYLPRSVPVPGYTYVFPISRATTTHTLHTTRLLRYVCLVYVAFGFHIL